MRTLKSLVFVLLALDFNLERGGISSAFVGGATVGQTDTQKGGVFETFKGGFSGSNKGHANDKEGDCPSDLNDCNKNEPNQCQEDKDCPQSTKCCFSACGLKCVPPANPEEEKKNKKQRKPKMKKGAK